ncbi:MAG: glycosyltransferase [Bacteroidales bacterium]|nr:glycosyltransferase [Bacteroidales bacterium]
MLTIQFLISTLGERIAQAAKVLLPPVEGVSYVVVWQRNGIGSDALPAELKEREDVSIVEDNGKGLARSRNIALENATADLLVITDDDNRYDTAAIELIRNAFEKHPTAGLIQFQALSMEGKPLRNYPAFPYTYETRPRGTYFCSVELVMRRKANLPRFDERFGLGAELGCGEEEVFVHEAVKRGVKMIYVPQPLVRTDGATTGGRFLTDAKVQKAKGAVLCILHGKVGAWLRLCSQVMQLHGITWQKRKEIAHNMCLGIQKVAKAGKPDKTPIYNKEAKERADDSIKEMNGCDGGKFEELTIVIPYFNREQFLPRTFRSLERSTRRAARLIFVDNGSQDGSRALCEDFAQRHPEQDILLLSESRSGAAIARNAGLAEVKTPWTYFFDSDDELSPRFIEQMEQTLKEHAEQNFDVIAFRTVMVHPDGSMTQRQSMFNESATDQILMSQLVTQNLFVRTDFLRRIGGWNEQLREWDDWELGIRVLVGGGKVLWLRDCAYHRIYLHPDSLTGKNFLTTCRGIDVAMQSVLNLCRERKKGRMDAQESSSICRALAFRYALLSGILLREGGRIASLRFWSRALQCASAACVSKVPRSLRLPLAFFRAYTSRGGRGAWRLARLFVTR